MKKLIGVLFCIVLLCNSCSEDEQPLTGDIAVTLFGTSTPIQHVGLFDPVASLKSNGYFYQKDAVLTADVTQLKAEFLQVNPGNYIVAVFNTNTQYQAVQVKAGFTASVGL